MSPVFVENLHGLTEHLRPSGDDCFNEGETSNAVDMFERRAMHRPKLAGVVEIHARVIGRVGAAVLVEATVREPYLHPAEIREAISAAAVTTRRRGDRI